MDGTTPEFDGQLRAAIDGKTKPLGSLGRIEALAATLARIQGTLSPRVETCALMIFAGDHGMAQAGVSAYPQDVTRQMALNFLSGGAAANVFAGAVGAHVHVVDAGMAGEIIDDQRLINRRIAPGTANAITAPAMTDVQCASALNAGAELGGATQSDVLCLGEMGIGNSSSAALVAAKTLGRPVSDLVGRGTGLDDEGLARKQALLRTASARTGDGLDAKAALTEYGGFEIAMMAGAMMGAARARRVVVVDGFIATAAALCARELAPGYDASFVYAHKSAEPGHAVILDALHAMPLLDLDMRLGEGTGALLAYPLVKAAAAMLTKMASFQSANVSGPA